MIPPAALWWGPAVGGLAALLGSLLAGLVGLQRQSGRSVLQGGMMILTLLAIAAVLLLTLVAIGKIPLELQPPQSDRPLEDHAS